uniref:AAA+ ATPase domain-containing protein n=1 Tax=Leersia perrieri TaxID=77586 RepID=A0A0D9Y035_9ORYZ
MAPWAKLLSQCSQVGASAMGHLLNDNKVTLPSNQRDAIKDGLKQRIISPDHIEITLENFPYYLSAKTKKFLIRNEFECNDLEELFVKDQLLTDESLDKAVGYALSSHLQHNNPNISNDAKIGVLLFGPPGTGKTLLAKAIATEAGENFINVSMPSVTSMWFREGEYVKAVFALASKISPSVIFIDEIDSMLGMRGTVGEPQYMRRLKK